ncbi:MAG TPA: DNA polymerase IV [Nitrospinaceae bacterium]|jgi:DNA polymerase-4|nr:DNA polymerase IV [Nitrospinaceae bacterium]|tara:strand:+ start:188 stop:1357 length:1170 start_codon:yes stop_codon:yes gene_type:complete
MNTELRKILHVDMDAFFVSVEEVLDPSLKGKPVVVGGDPEGRGVVAAASYAARGHGIHSAMPIAQAKRLCPHAIFLGGSHRRYSEYSAKVFEILKRYSPLVEPMSLDEAFVDLTGCERLHGPVLKSAEKIRNEILEELGLNASIGIASNKLLAKIASAYCKPNGMLWIAPGMEQRFLAPLPVRRIPGIGPKGEAELRRMGIKSVGDLARLPLELLEEAYGKWGVSLYRKARGISGSPVTSETEDPRSISRETTLEMDSADPIFLESTLSYLTEKVAGQLRENKLFAGTVTLKLRYSDFKTVTRSKTLEMPTAKDHTLFKTGVGLFRKLFTHGARVRLIGIAFTSLTATPYRQEDLFDPKGGQCWDGLYQGIDRIRHKYGFRAILRATSY